MVDKFLSAMILLVLMMIQSPLQSQYKIIADSAQNISNPWSPQRLIKPETLKDLCPADKKEQSRLSILDRPFSLRQDIYREPYQSGQHQILLEP